MSHIARPKSRTAKTAVTLDIGFKAVLPADTVYLLALPKFFKSGPIILVFWNLLTTLATMFPLNFPNPPYNFSIFVCFHTTLKRSLPAILLKLSFHFFHLFILYLCFHICDIVIFLFVISASSSEISATFLLTALGMLYNFKVHSVYLKAL